MLLIIAGLAPHCCHFCEDSLSSFSNLEKYFHFSQHYKEEISEYNDVIVEATEEKKTEYLKNLNVIKSLATKHKLKWDKENGV